MTNSKTVAFTWNAKTEAALKAAYTGKADNGRLAEIGKQFDNKTDSMIRSKLVSMGVYEKDEAKKAGTGKVTARKAETRQAIETLLSLPKNSLETLDKASKADLEAVSKALIALSDSKAAAKKA